MTQKDKEPEPSPGEERKERVLHTRVPAVLEQELKRVAEALRLPVSNLVRAILEDALSAVDHVGRRAEGELRGVAERLAQERDRLREMARGGTAARPSAPAAAPPSPAPDGMLGWQPLILASPSSCARCGRALAAGEQAYVGVPAAPGRETPIIGRECLPALAQEEDHDQPRRE